MGVDQQSIHSDCDTIYAQLQAEMSRVVQRMNAFNESAREWDQELREFALHKHFASQKINQLEGQLADLEERMAVMAGQLCHCNRPVPSNAPVDAEEEELEYFEDSSNNTSLDQPIPPPELVPGSTSPVLSDLDDVVDIRDRAMRFGSDTTLGGSDKENVFEVGETDPPLPVPGPDYYVRGVRSGQRAKRTVPPSFLGIPTVGGWGNDDFDWYACQSRHPNWTRQRVAELRAELRRDARRGEDSPADSESDESGLLSGEASSSSSR